jgi:uncharacterized coiled-coil protein SlyX
MGKRNEDLAPTEGSLTAAIDNLKSKVALMEEIVNAQVLEFKSELATSQAKMQSKFKKQLDDFLATFVKVQSSTPPPPPPPTKPPESLASHVVKTTEFQILLGEAPPFPTSFLLCYSSAKYAGTQNNTYH